MLEINPRLYSGMFCGFPTVAIIVYGVLASTFDGIVDAGEITAIVARVRCGCNTHDTITGTTVHKCRTAFGLLRDPRRSNGFDPCDLFGILFSKNKPCDLGRIGPTTPL
jgi:hypothetical protein